jgi:hypothetical protein
MNGIATGVEGIALATVSRQTCYPLQLRAEAALRSLTVVEPLTQAPRIAI